MRKTFLTIHKLKDVSNVHGLQAFTASLQAIDLLDLDVTQAFVVLHHVENAVRLEIAQLALQRFVVDVLAIDRLEFHFLEQLNDVIELDFHAFVSHVLDVTVELLNRVGVVVAAVALQLCNVVVVIGCGRVNDVLELVLVTESALFDVVGEVDALQMLVGLAVQLTVGFEVRFVAAQTARVVVVVHHDDEFLRETETRSVFIDVIVEFFKVVGVEV